MSAKLLGIAIAITLAAGTIMGVGMPANHSSPHPAGGHRGSDPNAPEPPWANPDGTINYSKLPHEITVVGEGGQPLHNPDGSIMTVDPRVEFGPPPWTPANRPPQPESGTITDLPGHTQHYTTTHGKDGEETITVTDNP
ncbi:MAG: hypothetical protein ACR2FF_10210 [Mycobacteriales bacterium]